MQRLLRNPRVLIFGGYLVLLALVAVFAPQLAPHDPVVPDPGAVLQGPSANHWLGTDNFGQDILSRLIYGARVSLTVSFAAVALAAVAGTLIGMFAGYIGGWAENLIMRLMDVILTLPPILLALFIVSFMSRSLINLIWVIGLLYTPRFARVAHGATLGVKALEYVQAGQAMGARMGRILIKSVLPNITAPLLVQASLGMGHALLLESGLSFLGMGPPPPTPTWGRMIEAAVRFMQLNPHTVIWPSVAISLTVVALNILGDALRDVLDPKLKL